MPDAKSPDTKLPDPAATRSDEISEASRQLDAVLNHRTDAQSASSEWRLVHQRLSDLDRSISIDDAVRYLDAIYRELESVEDYRLRLRWYVGLVLCRIERPRGIGGEIISEIGTRLWHECKIRIHKTQLYECERLHRTFEGDLDAFLRWIAEKKTFLNRPIYWKDVQEDILGGRSNPDVIGREEADQRDFRMAEEGIEALERVMMRAREGDLEAQGVVEGIRQSIAGLLVLGESSRPVTARCEEYLAYIRAQPCVICRRPADAHHSFGRRGTGLKSSDFTCIPLCHVHHMELHLHGRATFEREHRVNVPEIAFNLYHRFTVGAWVSMDLSGDGG